MNGKQVWKRGRGKLGVLQPLLGTWLAHADSPRGKSSCERTFKKALEGSHIELSAIWHFGETVYEERAYFGCDASGKVRFWSFTSDGKQATGELTDAVDVHPEAIGFVAQMPAGVARQVYWPDEAQGFHWAVESQTKKGWNRFVDHHYLAEPPNAE